MLQNEVILFSGNFFVPAWPTFISRVPVTLGRDIAAYIASIAAHVAALFMFALLHIEPPLLTSNNITEVTITSAEQHLERKVERPPAVVRKPYTAEEQNTLMQTKPAVSNTEHETGGESVTEARHDVAALNNPKPRYPFAARRQGIEGSVVLLVLVRADGSCGDVMVKQSSGYSVLDTAALETVRKWRFIPARRGARAVETRVHVPVTFRLTNDAG